MLPRSGGGTRLAGASSPSVGCSGQAAVNNVVSSLRCWNTLLLQPRGNRFIKCEIGRNRCGRSADCIELVFTSTWKDSANGSKEFKGQRIGWTDVRGAQSFCR